MIEKVAVTALTAALGLGGMFLAWRRRCRVNWIVAVGLLSEVPFVVTSVTDRYLLPLWTIFLLFAGFLISSIFPKSGLDDPENGVAVLLCRKIWPVLLDWRRLFRYTT